MGAPLGKALRRRAELRWGSGRLVTGLGGHAASGTRSRPHQRPAVGRRASSRVGRVAETPKARGARSSPKREAPGPCEIPKALELSLVSCEVDRMKCLHQNKYYVPWGAGSTPHRAFKIFNLQRERVLW